MESIVSANAVYYALQSKVITKTDLFKWIVNHPTDLNCLIAYRQLCCLDLEHGEFLESLDSEYRMIYGYIYILSGGETYDLKTKKSNIETLFKLNNCIKSLCGYMKDTVLCVSGFNKVNVSKENFISFVNCDRIEELQIKNHQQLTSILERMKLLSEIPDYYVHARPRYICLLKRHSVEKMIKATNIEHFKMVIKPEDLIVPSVIFELNDKVLQIRNQSDIVCSYMMGLEFFFQQPQLELINKRLILASKDPEQLIKLIQEHPVYKQEATNDTDTMSENWRDYLPLDIYSYNDGNHLYMFTRPEFEWLIKNRKNPWNNKELPQQVISYIEFLISFAKENKFPKPKVMNEMWSNPEFYQEPETFLTSLGIGPTSLIYQMIFNE